MQNKNKWIGQTIYVLVTLGITFIPTWIYLLARLTFQPEGFWQNFFLFGVGVYFLGTLQLILLVIGLCFLSILWMDKEKATDKYAKKVKESNKSQRL